MVERHDLPLSGGQNLHCAQGGEGPDVILIHGGMSVLEDMLIGPFDALAQRFRVTAFDRPGHGRSGRRRLDASIWRQAAMLHEGARRLGLDRPVVIGHSFGGAVAVAYGLCFPEETAAVVGIAPLAVPELRLEHLLFGPRAPPVLGDILARTAGPVVDAALGPVLLRAMFYPQEVPARVRSEFPFSLVLEPRHMQSDGEDAVEIGPGLALAAFRYPACRVPVRVLAGDRDRVVNNRLHGGTLASLVPDGGYLELEGVGHMLHHARPAAVVEAAAALTAAG
jgi:pimeloyl-ACP methyl ester carboxylesterase